MSFVNFFKGFAGAVLLAGATFAQAVTAVSGVTTVDGAAAPGGSAMVQFNALVPGGFDLASMSFEMTFDASLSFDAIHSRLVVNGADQDLSTGLTALFPDSVVVNGAPGSFQLSAFALTPTLVNSMSFRPVFVVSPTAQPGTSFAINVTNGEAVDGSFVAVPFSATAMIAVVPEPAEWLMLLAGLALAAGAARRRVRG